MAGSAAIDLADYTHSIGARIDGFLYRGLNRDDYAMIWVSNGFEALTGLSGDEFVRRRMSFSDLIHPEDLTAVNDAVAAALATDGRWQVAYRLKTPRGWRFVHETGGGCERDPETGEILYLDGIILDSGRLTNVAERLEMGRASVSAMNGSIAQIFSTLKTLRLLALNARIEAARAAEHGLGFNVVAQEMNALASAGETLMKRVEEELSRLNDAVRL
ncbi:PAS domain-containing protein [Methylopila henanensis]|uniref:PAS domain-containing protein n=1 Tax=Methylopila henanensis TaxID=873516 RepID=A0ABW4K3V2_9HYPH